MLSVRANRQQKITAGDKPNLFISESLAILKPLSSDPYNKILFEYLARFFEP
jgi:hypothetical protein